MVSYFNFHTAYVCHTWHNVSHNFEEFSEFQAECLESELNQFLKLPFCQIRQLTPLIPALRRLRQEAYKFKLNMGYIVKSCLQTSPIPTDRKGRAKKDTSPSLCNRVKWLWLLKISTIIIPIVNVVCLTRAFACLQSVLL